MFRNKEIKQVSILFFMITCIFATAGFMVCMTAGILELVSAGILGIVFYVFTKARYKRIAQLSEQIDMVLHDAEHLCISESEEGELCILQSEIVKMTLRIREQNRALRNEKKHLADSLADISHQLRTPLTSVNIILSLLEKNTDKKEQKALIREAGELFEQMDFLLVSLLKLSRLDAGIVVFKKERIDISNLISVSLRPFLIPMELHHIQIQTKIPEKIEISGDFRWLSEAFQNIVKNCMESVGDNGKIKIACEDNPLFTEITFHDDGAGFEEEDLPHLFERFYRGKGEDATGYGIGLALCRTIIMQQGGTILAKNHSQGGAVFSVRFIK
ncbi:MAG: HAMP domain-containing histidine kinase [Lachnospiraceae bacterium]|nr:HAMP domain-containing histidine kinase [Lachnospiraceae bacterium]